MPATFQDHFSTHAQEYARHRPSSPPELLEFLLGLVNPPAAVWDCATGNGQVAIALAQHSTQVVRVIANDASREQLAHAVRHPRVQYLLFLAESTPLATQSIDLCTVGQALHWLHLESFYQEVRRVLRPGGLLAAWTYSLLSISGRPEMDRLVKAFYSDTVGPYWPPERCHVDAGYRTLPFPFETIKAPSFFIEAEWSLSDLQAYLNTWSAVMRYEKSNGTDPVEPFLIELSRHWPAEETRTVRWPVHLLLGRVAKLA